LRSCTLLCCQGENERLDEILAIIRMGREQHCWAARLSTAEAWSRSACLLARIQAPVLVDEPVAGMTGRETGPGAGAARDHRTHSVVVVEQT